MNEPAASADAGQATKTKVNEPAKPAPDGAAGAGGAPAAPPAKKSLLAGAADQGQGQTSGDPKAGAAAVAEIEIKLPDGVKVDTAVLEQFKGIAKEVGISGDVAGKLVAWEVARSEKLAGEQVAAWDKQSDDWYEALRSDPDMGGKNFDANAVLVQRAVARFGGPELVADLQRLGIENLPSLARAFWRIGQAVAEDNTGARGAAQGGVHQLTEAELLKKLYPNS
jgi:hypothetical protein